MKLVAFDLETTGLEPERDRVLEFCFAELDEDLKERGRWTRLVDPGLPVPKEIEQLTGITTAMVAGQPPFAAHAPRIQALVRDAVLIAHNSSFDVPFLHRELVRAGQPGLAPDHPCIDTLVIERHVNSHRLAEVYKRYVGEAFDGGHRSSADVAATVEVLRRQREAHGHVLPGAGASLDGLLVSSVDRHFGGEAKVRQWLDHGHRFYKDGCGTIRFGFGPYRSCPAVQLHECRAGGVGHHGEFLRWMLRRDFPEETKATAAMVLKLIEPRPFSAPGPAAPQEAMAALVERAKDGGSPPADRTLEGGPGPAPEEVIAGTPTAPS